MFGEYVKNKHGKGPEKLVLGSRKENVLDVYDDENGAHCVLFWAYEAVRPATEDSLALAEEKLQENIDKLERLLKSGDYKHILKQYKTVKKESK